MPKKTVDIRIEFPSQGETYSRDEYGVYEYSTYPRSSVLAGQERRSFLDSFETLEQAQAKYPTADISGCGYHVPSLGHLPDEDDDHVASREEQYGRYLDCGPQNWDDR